MARWLTLVLSLACLGGLAAPGPTPRSRALRELIEELVNITQDQKAPLCHGTMVWKANLTGDLYCAALGSLMNVSSCDAIRRTQRMLGGLCTHGASPGGSAVAVPDTKIEVGEFLKDLLGRLKRYFRHGKFD